MSGFQKRVQQDIRKVFLNTQTFGETRTICFNEKEYNIPVVLAGPTAEKRTIHANDSVSGLHQVSAVLCCAAEDLGGSLPVPHSMLEIMPMEGEQRVQTYGVVSVTARMGLVRMELEALA